MPKRKRRRSVPLTEEELGIIENATRVFAARPHNDPAERRQIEETFFKAVSMLTIGSGVPREQLRQLRRRLKEIWGNPLQVS